MKSNPHNYDAWFDYLRLMEAEGEHEVVRDLYERAISNIPPSRVRTVYSYGLHDFAVDSQTFEGIWYFVV